MAPENLDLEIRAQLGRYVRGEATLAEFKEWFAPSTWNVHQSGNPRAADLAYSVDALLAQFSEGEFGEGRLKSRLSRYVETYRFVYGEEQQRPAVSLTERPIIQRQVVAAGR